MQHFNERFLPQRLLSQVWRHPALNCRASIYDQLYPCHSYGDLYKAESDQQAFNVRTRKSLPLFTVQVGKVTHLNFENNAQDSEDTRHMAEALEQLGVEITADWDEKEMVIHGCGGRFPNRGGELYLGNAGTAMRYISHPLIIDLAALHHSVFLPQI